MAYEKYIRKDGRLYGPYIYHSKRVDGRVVSEYHGQGKPWKKFLWLIPLVALIIFGAYIIGQKQARTTGYSILGINADYQEGKPLEGSLALLLNQGELIPAESMVVFDNGGTRYEYPLLEMTSEQTTEGNFFIAGKNLSGSGVGYGIPGTKTVSPGVSFVLLIYSRINETEDTESEREISDSVFVGSDFTYELLADERAELKPRSVVTGVKQLNDEDISVITEGNIVTVTTQYTEEENGFGEGYVGTGTKDIGIDLTGLNLTLQPGALDVSIVYHSEEILSLQTIVGQGDVTGEAEISPEVVPEISRDETNITEIPIRELSLTPEEKTALENKFGNISLSISKAISKNGFIITRYDLGNLWIEYSYSSGLSEETLSGFMEADRIKWLRDIAQSLLYSEDSGQILKNFTGNYSY